MVRPLTSGMLAQTQAKALMPALFIEVDVPAGNLYTWSGYGDIVWGGHTWKGAGEMLGISNVSEVSQVQAAGVSITLSGIPAALIAMTLANLRRYMTTKMWIGALDATFAVIADPYLFFNGFVDSAALSQDGKTASITVTAESRLISLRIERFRRYTDQDQRIERPYDGGFKFVDFLQDTELVFHG